MRKSPDMAAESIPQAAGGIARLRDAGVLPQKLPLVREAQLGVLLAQLRRERVERRRQPQDRQRRLVDVLAAAGALDDRFAEAAVAADRDLQDRVAGAVARDLREVERAQPLDLAPPARRGTAPASTRACWARPRTCRRRACPRRRSVSSVALVAIGRGVRGRERQRRFAPCCAGRSSPLRYSTSLVLAAAAEDLGGLLARRPLRDTRCCCRPECRPAVPRSPTTRDSRAARARPSCRCPADYAARGTAR